MECKVKPLEEVSADSNGGGWMLCFQWCEYKYEDGSKQHGYRFIWRRPTVDGKSKGDLQAARGQARLPSIAEAEKLMAKAKAAGWGDKKGDD